MTSPIVVSILQRDEEFAALKAQLEAAGLPLLDSTTRATLIHDLLVALKTANAARAREAMKKQRERDRQNADFPQQPGVTMSVEWQGGQGDATVPTDKTDPVVDRFFRRTGGAGKHRN